MNTEPIDKISAEFVEDTGFHVLNGFLLAETEREHCLRLLEMICPKPNAVILDAGCGVGAVAAHMAKARPDLRWHLLNLSEAQLEMCPDGMATIHASYDDIPLADKSVDVVMFNYALCHSGDWLKTLQEANRVLREGGTLFVFDMARINDEGPARNPLMAHVLQASAYTPDEVQDVACRAGFALIEQVEPDTAGNRLKHLMGDDVYDLVVGDVAPMAWRFRKLTIQNPITSAFARHDRIGFQFSGGRDSTAALYLLRQFWPYMTVYHLDTGDQFPETVAVVNQVEAEFVAAGGSPFVRIKTDVHHTREHIGLASDLVPVDNTAVGRLVSGRDVKIISRYDCCGITLMAPMHERIRADGITLLIRGQRDDEYAKQPKRSGDIEHGIEFLYPIQDWSGEQVQAYLNDNGHPVAPFYERGARRAPECMGCTAWWDEGRADYLRQYHPIKFAEYRANMRTIRAEIDRQYQMLDEKE